MKNEPMELAAIWLNRPVGKYVNGKFVKSSRIMPGDEIRVENMAIQYGSDNITPHHIVIGCFGEVDHDGNLDNRTLEFLVIDKRSLYPQIINAQREPNLK